MIIELPKAAHRKTKLANPATHSIAKKKQNKDPSKQVYKETANIFFYSTFKV